MKINELKKQQEIRNFRKYQKFVDQVKQLQKTIKRLEKNKISGDQVKKGEEMMKPILGKNEI